MNYLQLDNTIKKTHCGGARSRFFAERVINIWNDLPATVNFSSLSSFKSSIGRVDLSEFIKCILCRQVVFSCFYFILFTFNSVSTKLIVVELVLSVSFCS